MNLSFDEWYDITHIEFYNQICERYGQFLWNSLYKHKPRLAYHIQYHVKNDPYFDDQFVSSFIDFVRRNWDKEVFSDE